MIVVRPVRLNDLDALLNFAKVAVGITNLPNNRSILESKILSSQKAFSQDIKKPDLEDYIFVLEDQENGKIGGTCGLRSRTGVCQQIHFYKLETLHPQSTLGLPLTQEMQILKPVSYPFGPSEVCALYLDPDFRREGLGRLLSLNRFLFIAANPHRFEESIIAEMRGVILINDVSPFWEGLGRHFLNIEFNSLMTLMEKGRDFIPEVLPKWPIYVSLLSKEAREVIGKTHMDSKPALNMLINEGFAITDEIDLFDGGPKIQAKTAEIRSIKESRLAKINDLSLEDISSDQFLLSNERIDYRACYGKIKKISDNQIILTKKVAAALKVEPGDSIRYVLPHAAKK